MLYIGYRSCVIFKSPFSCLLISSFLRSSHHHHYGHAHRAYNPSHTNRYSEGVTSAPGTMNHPCGGRQRSIGYEDMHQCSLPKPVSNRRNCDRRPNLLKNGPWIRCTICKKCRGFTKKAPNFCHYYFFFSAYGFAMGLTPGHVTFKLPAMKLKKSWHSFLVEEIQIFR